MNPLFSGLTLWSFRKEFKLVLTAFLILISLPIIAVFILVHTGINVVSDALVGVDTQTNTIQIKDPKDGSIVKEISPTVARPAQGVLTLLFGQSSFVQVFHTGIDIANPEGFIGDPVTPFMDGTVIYEGEIFWGYGKHIIIDHGDNITSVYAHLDKIYVYKGQEVHIGDTIGLMGQTGWATGPHLHFEIRLYGIPVDPLVFLGD